MKSDSQAAWVGSRLEADPDVARILSKAGRIGKMLLASSGRGTSRTAGASKASGKIQRVVELLLGRARHDQELEGWSELPVQGPDGAPERQPPARMARARASSSAVRSAPSLAAALARACSGVLAPGITVETAGCARQYCSAA